MAQNYTQFGEFLYQQIPKDSKQKFPGLFGLQRTKCLFKLLDNPQNKLKVVHIAGTSGKGSTAYLISVLLRNHGFKTGFHISPHLLDLRERFQINNQLLDQTKVFEYFSQIYPVIIEMRKTKYGLPTYFEILTALAFYIFYKEKVDYAVIETGIGGWYDATNCVIRKDKLSVLTKIGLDHTQILGKTIRKIALQKAMIIQKNNQVISIEQDPEAMGSIEQIVKKQKAKLFFINKNTVIKKIQVLQEKTVFNFSFLDYSFKKLQLKLIGFHQAENASLALGSLILLAKIDRFGINEQMVRKTFEQAQLSGRLEMRKTGKKILILDGAHNPQKMSALVKTLIKIFPDKKITALIAFKNKKDYKGMLNYLTKICDKIIVTSFFSDNQDLVHLSESPYNICETLNQFKFNNYQIITQSKKAYRQLLKEKNELLLVTGSLYLLSEIYSHC